MTILYQDNRIIVCLKPAGVVSVDETGGMPSLLRAALSDGNACIRTVHRLDAAAGGVMVFARSRMAAALLSQQIRARTFEKEYLAVIHGCPAALEGTLCDYLGYDRSQRRAFRADAPSRDVREAVLDYRVLENSGGLSLLAVRLHTGRTHQIRAQLALRGMPLFADRKYGAEDGGAQLALWSRRLAFTHPQSGQRMEFTAAPPESEPWTNFAETVSKIEREGIFQ